MITILSLRQAGSKETIEFMTSSPEGDSISDIVETFMDRHQAWEFILRNTDVVLLRDNSGTYWVGEHAIFDQHCEIHTHE